MHPTAVVPPRTVSARQRMCSWDPRRIFQKSTLRTSGKKLRLDAAQGRDTVAHATWAEPVLHRSRGGGGRSHEGHAEARRELQGRHPEARPASSSTEVGMRLPPKMTPAQIAEAQRMAREWKRLGAPGKSRSECALDERAAPREGSFARPTEPAGAPYEVGRCAGPACPEPL